MLLVYSAPSGAVTVIEPVATAQVGCTLVLVTVGAPVAVLISSVAVASHEPATELLTVIVLASAPSRERVGDAWKVVPSMLKVYSAHSGAVTVLEQVATAQVGCTLVL